MSPEAAQRLLQLVQLVLAAPINLTAIRDPAEVRRKHLADSLSCLRVVRCAAGQRLLDIGSGGGFPGLPLAVACPELELDLLEANARKGDFLRRTATALALTNVRVVVGRAEDAGHLAEYRARFDWVVARAVAPLPVLLEYGLPFCRMGGRMVAMKGPRADEEVAQATRAVGVLGGRWAERIDLSLPGAADARSLICAIKVRDTPRRYPRGPGVPSRHPL